MTTIELCMNGTGDFVSANLRDVPELLRSPHAFVWIDVEAGDEADLHQLGDMLSLHQIAVDSALSDRDRAKIMLFEDMLYVEFFGIRESGSDFEADNIGIFVGERFLITARRDDKPSLESLRKRWHEEVEHLHKRPAPRVRRHLFHTSHPAPTSVKLLYTVLDELVDSYLPVLDALGDRLEDLEDNILAGDEHNPQSQIQDMRSTMLRLRRLLSPEEAVLNTLLRRDIPIVEDAMVPYFADIQGHLLRVHDWLETYRDQASSLVDLQISLQSHRLNQTMRIMTASSIILMVCALIAGIYGMNFHNMPELGWRFGYPFALGLMATLGIGLALLFRQKGWWRVDGAPGITDSHPASRNTPDDQVAPESVPLSRMAPRDAKGSDLRTPTRNAG